jgi:phytol kinase
VSAVFIAGEAFRALLVCAAVLLVFALAEVWKRRAAPPAEWTRKLVHVGIGLIAAGFPWMFRSPVTVAVLGVLFALVIWGTRRFGLLGSVHCVERRSEGDFYYLAAITGLYLVGHGQPLFYTISLLVLAVADSAAALVGQAYGRRAYAVETDRRSLEGSIAFFIAALAMVAGPLLLSGREPAAALLIGLQLALLVTAMEAISVRGNDNLIVPVATFYLLVKMTRHPAEWIALQVGAQLLILLLVALAARRWRALSASGAVAAHLFIYGALALCGPSWLVAPLAALAGLALLSPDIPRKTPSGAHQVGAVFYVTAVAAALFLLDNTFTTLLPKPAWLGFDHPFYVPFVGALAAHLSLLAASRSRHLHAVLAALAVILAGLWLGPGGLNAGRVLTAALICFAGAGIYAVCRGLAIERRADLRLQALSVAAATLAVLPLHLKLSAP